VRRQQLLHLGARSAHQLIWPKSVYDEKSGAVESRYLLLGE